MLKKNSLFASRLALSICCAILISCQTMPKAAQEDDIREAVFRFQFQSYDSKWLQTFKVFYLSLGDKHDPTDDFLQRFKDTNLDVRKASLADRSAGEIKDGLIFYIKEIKWISNKEVQVSGGHFKDGLNGSGRMFQVLREKGKWLVKKDTVIWVSKLNRSIKS
jgi:hypothetical protein